MRQIAQIIKRNKSTVTALVNKLAALGYLERRKADADDRVTPITLTEKGKAREATFICISKKLSTRLIMAFPFQA